MTGFLSRHGKSSATAARAVDCLVICAVFRNFVKNNAAASFNPIHYESQPSAYRGKEQVHRTGIPRTCAPAPELFRCRHSLVTDVFSQRVPHTGHHPRYGAQGHVRSRGAGHSDAAEREEGCGLAGAGEYPAAILILRGLGTGVLSRIYSVTGTV